MVTVVSSVYLYVSVSQQHKGFHPHSHVVRSFVSYDMPKKSHKGTLPKKPTYSRKASAKANVQHRDVGIAYSQASSLNSSSHALRDLQQVSYPELCTWGPKTCKQYLVEAGVLSDELPLCHVCCEPYVRTGRNVNDPLKCTTKNCDGHNVLSYPLEAFTPLHSQARQHQEVDYVNFLRCCYLVGIKTPPDALQHLLQDVNRKRVAAWCQDIRLALATAEYCDSMAFEFGPGVLEFDTATAVVQRKPKEKHVTEARRTRALSEKRGKKVLKQHGKKVLERAKKCSLRRPAAKAIFRGRHIVFTLRTIQGQSVRKKYAILPLPPKLAHEGQDLNC